MPTAAIGKTRPGLNAISTPTNGIAFASIRLQPGEKQENGRRDVAVLEWDTFS